MKNAPLTILILEGKINRPTPPPGAESGVKLLEVTSMTSGIPVVKVAPVKFASFTVALVKSADLTGAILIGTTLNTADFTNATVNDANFTGATLTTGIPEVIDVTSSNLTPDSAPGGGVGLLILPSNISIVSGAFFIFSPVIQIKQLILAQKNKTLSILTEDGKTFQIIA